MGPYARELIDQHKARKQRLMGAINPNIDDGIDLRRTPAPPPERPILARGPPSSIEHLAQESEALLEQVFSAQRGAEPASPSIADILRAVADVHRITTVDIRSARRDARAVRSRHIAMYLCRMLTLRSMPEIGRKLGGKDHTTVLHGVRKIAGMRNEPEVAMAIDGITALLRARGFAVEAAT